MNWEEPGSRPHLSVVIPTWNGLHLLKNNLPSVLTALEQFKSQLRKDYELIIVDDGSRDATSDWVTSQYPSARLIRRPDNGGFSKTCNTGFDACRGRVVALLNNDLQLEHDYFLYLYPHFEDDAVFAVTARVFEWDPPIFSGGGRVGRFRRGFWSMHFNYDVRESSAREWIEQHRLLSACAIGQASAAVFAREARGRGAEEMLAALGEIETWLGEEGEGAQPRWPGIAVLAPARAYPARHGAILMPWKASVSALCKAPHAR